MARIEHVLSGFQHACLAGGTPPLSWLWAQRKRADRADAWDSQLGEDVALADETIDAVRAMTIHKAKGLEGRVVIVLDWGGLLQSCFTARRGRSNGGTYLERTDGEGRSVRELTLRWGPIVVRTPGYCAAMRREEESSLQESRRLAYVAATRARDRLILLHPVKRSTRQLVEHRENAVVAGHVRGGRPQGGQPELPSGAQLPSTFDGPAYRRIWEARLAGDGIQDERLLLTPTDPSLEPKELGESEAREEPSARRAGAKDEGLVIGRLVHSYLERAHEFADLDRDLVDALASELDLAGDSTVVQETGRILEKFLAGVRVDGVGRALVERLRCGRIRGREVPVYLKQDGRRWHGIIDLILEEEDGLVGVDYKTGRPADPLPESYLRQQEIYRAALERIAPGRPVAFEFWWLG
jgi:ATP-dependent helicase/nuclease subunit A